MPRLPLRLALASGLVFASAALAPRAARAEEPPHAKDDATKHAKELFEQGTTLFNLGEFDKAIEAWQEGYKAKPDPGFLYNIGQAYRLKGDPAKAIFFYRGYLRTSPKAPNRADVEAKIAGLQKEVEAKPAAAPPSAPPPAAPPPAVTPTPPVAAPPRTPPAAPEGPPSVAPPPVGAPPLAGATAAPPPPAPMAEEEAPPVVHESRPIDVNVGLGFEKWTSGFKIDGGVPAQFVWSVGGGFTFGDVFGPVSFRLGALFERTSIEENLVKGGKNTLAFSSFLAEPALRVRLVDQRLYLGVALGIGGTAVGGVKPASVVIDPKEQASGVSVNGSPGAFTLRPAVSVQVHVTKGLVLTATPAFSLSPRPAHFYQALNRFELLFGAAYLF